jgi:hypothetical protein
MSLAVMPYLFSLLVAAVIAAAAIAPAMAEDKYDIARRQYPELFKAYYDANVLEYCGLLTEQSAGGFRWSRDALIERDTVSDDQHRNVRISAYAAVDYEYQNRGLSGYKKWCRTEGKDAYDRFIAIYIAHHDAAP